MFRLKFILAILFAYCSAIGVSQDLESIQDRSDSIALRIASDNDLLLGHINFLKPLEDQIPSLDALIQICIDNHPRVKFQEENQLSTESQVQFAKREWATNVVGSVNYYEGANNQQITTFDNINTSNSLTNGLRYGVTVNVPLYLFYGRKKRIGLYEHANKAEEWKIKEVEQEVSREVVRWYSQMIHFQRLMIIDSKALEVAKVNFENAEQEFNRGFIDLNEYSRIQSLMRKSLVDFEFARSEFYSTYKQFEVLIGDKLINLRHY